MTEMLFGAVNAYNQIMFLFMGAVLLGIGGAVIGYDLYTRRTWTRVSGKIVGAKEKPGSAGKKGALYTAVFEYTGADGKTRQSLGASSSSFLGDKIPGTRLRLLVNPKDPEDTLRPGWWLLVLGLIFAVPGFFFLVRAIMQGGASLLYTPLVLLAAAGYIGFRIKKAIKPRDQWQNHEAFRARVEKNPNAAGYSQDRRALAERGGDLGAFEEIRPSGLVVVAFDVSDRGRAVDRGGLYETEYGGFSFRGLAHGWNGRPNRKHILFFLGRERQLYILPCRRIRDGGGCVRGGARPRWQQSAVLSPGRRGERLVRSERSAKRLDRSRSLELGAACRAGRGGHASFVPDALEYRDVPRAFA